MELIPKELLFPLEEIRPITGYKGLYYITNYGRVWSLRTKKFLKHSSNGRGYFKVILCKNKKKYTAKIHRIEGEAFIPNPNNLPQINHKDGDKINNFAGLNKNNYKDSNLEWCDNYYNTCHAIQNGLCKRDKKTSKYFCVYFSNIKGRKKKWIMRIKHTGTKRLEKEILRYFYTEIEAAQAYNRIVLSRGFKLQLNKID